MLKSIAIAAAIALTGGGVAIAQDPTGAALVNALFAQVEREILPGQRALSAFRGTLAKDGGTKHEFNAVAGTNYLVIGVCDEGCSDLDLGVYNDAGELIEGDVEADDTPAVVFAATQGGRHQIAVVMPACTSRCAYGVNVYPQ